ncbi:hypothetical protein AAVH_41653, partial [Aphelenchoides avenae]
RPVGKRIRIRVGSPRHRRPPSRHEKGPPLDPVQGSLAQLRRRRLVVAIRLQPARLERDAAEVPREKPHL